MQSSYSILASACLCGEACRYDGVPATVPELAELCRKGVVLPVCPEILGGLSVPRPPCEILHGRVLTPAGDDKTGPYMDGARETLRLAQKYGVKVAVLKERSPSCGTSIIYDGTFSHKRIPGKGVTAELLHQNGIAVFNEEGLPLALDMLGGAAQDLPK